MYDSPIPWEDLVVYHARKLHVVILGADLDVMGHIHPEGACSTLAPDGCTLPDWTSEAGSDLVG